MAHRRNKKRKRDGIACTKDKKQKKKRQSVKRELTAKMDEPRSAKKDFKNCFKKRGRNLEGGCAAPIKK
jgi:predicted secreted Zn-dependent protease